MEVTVAERERISVTLALESLREQVEEAEEARQEHLRAMARRNNLIRDARDAGVASRILQQITRLSRDRIARIVTSPHDPLGD